MQTAALVTGSSRGIGRAVALELARQGWDICVNYHQRADAAAETAQAVRALGRRAITVQADVSDRVAVNAMVARCRAELGGIGVLVNNAGVAGQALFQDVDDALWDRYFGVNLQGARNTVQAVLPAMLHEKCGSIVNISSIGGVGCNAGISYSAAKAAVIAMTKNVAIQFAGTGIRCNSVAPGPTPTELNTPEAVATFDAEFAAQCNRHFDATVPEVSADDQAYAILFFASDESKAVNGQVMIVDNGCTI